MSIQVNNAIYTLLTSNTGFTAVVSTRVYPIIAPNDTPMPFVVINRDFTPQYTRDGACINESNIEITILSTNYDQSVQIALLIDGILNSYQGIVCNIHIVDCRLINSTEEYSNDAFIQKLIYTTKNY